MKNKTGSRALDGITSIGISRVVHAELQRRAREVGMSMSDLTEYAITLALSQPFNEAELKRVAYERGVRELQERYGIKP